MSGDRITTRMLYEEIQKLYSETKRVKTILIGDGTVESMKDSIQQRLINVETKLENHINGTGDRLSDGNGGFVERRRKKSLIQQFRELSISKKLSTIVIAIPFIASYWEWILDKMHQILNWLETISR